MRVQEAVIELGGVLCLASPAGHPAHGGYQYANREQTHVRETRQAGSTPSRSGAGPSRASSNGRERKVRERVSDNKVESGGVKGSDECRLMDQPLCCT